MMTVDEAHRVSGRHGGYPWSSTLDEIPNESGAEGNMSGTAENDSSKDVKDSEEETGPETNPETGKAFTQKELDDIAGKSRSQGRQSTLKEVAEELGMSVTDAKKFIDAAKTAEREQLEEHERIRLEAEELKATAQEELAQAKAATLRASVTVALNTTSDDSGPLRADVGEKAQEMVIETAIRKAAEAPEGEDPVAFGTAYVREASPEWFGTSDGSSQDSVSKGSTPKAKGSPAAKKQSVESDPKSRYDEWKSKRKLRPLNS